MSLHVQPTVAFNLAQAVLVQAIISEAVVVPRSITFRWEARNQGLYVIRRGLPGFDSYVTLLGQFIQASDEAELALQEYRVGLCKLSKVRHLIKRMASFSSDYDASLKSLRMMVKLSDEAHIMVSIRNVGLDDLLNSGSDIADLAAD